MENKELANLQGEITEIGWAWLAGLFEGEGSIVFTGTNSVTLNLKMCDLDIVERVHTLTGVGSIAIIELENPKHNTGYHWRVCNKKDITPILQELLPFFGERRTEKAIEALARLERNMGS